MNNTFANSSPDTTTFVIKNKSKKAIIIFGVKINPGLSYDLMQIPGVSEHDIRSSVVKGELLGKLKANQIEIIDVNIDLYTDDDQLGSFLSSKGISSAKTSVASASSAVPNGSTLLKATIAALTATLDASNGQLAFVETNRGLYVLDTESTLTASNLYVLNSAESNSGADPGRWIRLPVGDGTWQAQTSFIINHSTGNDENDASSLYPIKTWDEFYRRTQGKLNDSVEVILISPSFTWPIGDHPYGTFDIDNDGELTIKGDLTGLDFGSLSVYTFTQANAATNVRQSVQDGDVDFSTLVGKYVYDGLGYSGWILKDLTSNTGQLTEDSGLNPLTGDPAFISNQLVMNGGLSNIGVVRGKLIFKYIQFNSFVKISTGGSSNLLPFFGSEKMSIEFNSCKMQSFHIASGATFINCYFTTNNLTTSIPSSNGTYFFSGCGFSNGYISKENEKCYFENCSFMLDNYSAIDMSNNSFVTLKGNCAFWGSSGGSDRVLALRFNAMGNFDSNLSLYGDNIAVHLFLQPAAKLLINFSANIYLIGQPLSTTSFIPPLTAGDPVPTTSTITTWADLAAPPFSNNLFNYTNGSQINIVS